LAALVCSSLSQLPDSFLIVAAVEPPVTGH